MGADVHRGARGRRAPPARRRALAHGADGCPMDREPGPPRDGRRRRRRVQPPRGAIARLPSGARPDPRRRRDDCPACPARCSISAPEDDDLRRGAAAALLGLAFMGRAGTSRPRIGWYADGMARVQRAGNLSDASVPPSPWRTSGSLRDGCERRCGRTSRPCNCRRSMAGPVLRGTADMYVGLSDLVREQGDLAGRRHGICRRAGTWASTWATRRTAYRLARRGGPHPAGRRGPRWRARCTRRGRAPVHAGLHPGCASLAGAKGDGSWSGRAGWPRRCVGSGAGPVALRTTSTYLREFEHVTLARVLLAQSSRTVGRRLRSRRLWTLLGRLLRAAEEGQRTGSVIEILVLLALAHQARDDLRRRACRPWTRPGRWPNRRAMSGSSSMRAHPWRPCCKRREPGECTGTTFADF